MWVFSFLGTCCVPPLGQAGVDEPDQELAAGGGCSLLCKQCRLGPGLWHRKEPGVRSVSLGSRRLFELQGGGRHMGYSCTRTHRCKGPAVPGSAAVWAASCWLWLDCGPGLVPSVTRHFFSEHLLCARHVRSPGRGRGVTASVLWRERQVDMRSGVSKCSAGKIGGPKEPGFGSPR